MAVCVFHLSNPAGVTVAPKKAPSRHPIPIHMKEVNSSCEPVPTALKVQNQTSFWRKGFQLSVVDSFRKGTNPFEVRFRFDEYTVASFEADNESMNGSDALP